MRGTRAGRAGTGRHARSGWLKKGRLAAASAVVAAALGATSVAVAPGASAAPAAVAAPAGGTITVIVGSSGFLSPVSAVLDVLGNVVSQFHIINAVEATIPAVLEPLLASLPGITVTPDARVSVQSAVESTGPHTPSDDFIQQTGANQLFSQGDTGQGVTVAVMDTGIDNLPDFAGRLIGGVDLSGEGNPFEDSYGHGTFVAGLIAGNGASSNGQYTGEAPGADLVSIKVAGANGSTDLATLITGLQWAIDHENQYNISVLNMSLGFKPFESTVVNPLDQAVEAAWNSGIAVITSAGNAGPTNGTILSPGDDPLAITVGALDDLAQTDPTQDEMNDFSSVGPTTPDGWAKPDLVTSGRSVVSVAAPGSTVYNQNPQALVGTGNFVGSGTSFSSAITAGAAALVLANNPNLTPNQVKARLLGTTNPGPVGNPFVDGHGALNAEAAATAGPMNLNQSTAFLLPTLLGIQVPLSPNGDPVDTWNLNLWSGQSPTSAGETGAAWNNGGWTGAAWNGGAWNGMSWAGAAWNNGGWSGAAWNGGGWSGAAWNGGVWKGSAWNSAAWNSGSWQGTAWN